jgi:ubiquitin C-terminal hydrolase
MASITYTIEALRKLPVTPYFVPHVEVCSCGERFTQHAPNQIRCPTCAKKRAALMLRRRQERYRRERKEQA